MHSLSAIHDAYLSAPEEAVFLERARILHESRGRYAHLPPGMRQGEVLQDLCARITVVVNPADVLLGRVLEEVPAPADEQFVRAHPELFVEPGVPGWLDSAGIYIPDWSRLLTLGIGGLVSQIDRHLADTEQRGRDLGATEDVLRGIRVSLLAVSRLMERYAAEALRVAGRQPDRRTSSRLVRAAQCCEAVAMEPPEGFRQALQLFISFHMVLSCLIGGRNVTPGRMDRYLFSFYERDTAGGALAREEAVELLAVMMIMLSQLSGRVATDFQSKKRTPNRFSHYYITLGGVDGEGESAVNDLSRAFLEARRLVRFRDPSLSVRYFAGIDRTFWHEAVSCMRDRMPVFAYNDEVVIRALTRHGVPERAARDYAHCGCMNCVIPGRELPLLRANHNGPLSVLLAMNGGRDPLSGQRAGAATPPPQEPADFDAFWAAFGEQLASSLRKVCCHYGGDDAGRFGSPPLSARALFEGGPAGMPATRYADQHLVGVATTIDSLLAIRQLVYRERALSLEEFAGILCENFAGREPLRRRLLNRLPCYGSDDPDVTGVVERFSHTWVDQVRRAGAALSGIRLRPAFYSWLFNIEMGERTGATPDGRLRGEPLSADQAPTAGKSRAPTEVLQAMAHLSHDHTCSGGTTFHLSPSHFVGQHGLERLATLIEAYFAQGGLHLQFIFADSATLREAVDRPEEHRDLLVRVTGFSEYFVRLPPDVQQEIIGRAEYGEPGM